MEKTIEIPEGYKARIDGNKIILELRESKDEKIRKDLITFLDDIWHLGRNSNFDKWDKADCSDWIAWLEKQGEQKPNPYSGTSFEYNGHTWGMCARDNGIEILIDGHIKGRVFADDINAKETFIKALERVEEQNAKGYKLTDCDKNSWWEDFKAYCSYSEQKLANSAKTCKDEPKFKVGDRITNGIDVDKIIGIDLEDENYLFENGRKSDISLVESISHIWTIQDAKDGDVLSFNDGHGNDSIELIKSITDKKIEFWFCLTNGNRYEVFDGITPYTNLASRKDATPATKEQCDQLEKAMADAGYRWDPDEKKMEKIAQKPAWSEEDEENFII